MSNPYEGDSITQTIPGITGKNTNSGLGVEGISDKSHGVYGLNEAKSGILPDRGVGVWGDSQNGLGVFGTSQFIGVVGQSTSVHGVYGLNQAPSGLSPGEGAGVWGDSTHGLGVVGTSGSIGVVGKSTVSHGVYGLNQAQSGFAPDRGVGVWGDSKNGVGVLGTSAFIGVIGQGSVLAARFVGTVEVTGDILLPGADCAEHFDFAGADEIDPGTVMVISGEGRLRQSKEAYDKKVAGVVSGAGEYKAGIVLDKQHSQGSRAPVALVGKVYCKVDAQYSPVEVGDLLTSSPTPGHAMKADNPLRAFGAVIGKALRPLAAGQGLIPILVALQ